MVMTAHKDWIRETYMKFLASASSIVFMSCIFILAGCDSLGLPSGVLHHDEVPPEVKAEPRLVETPPPIPDDEAWPRLGDVPFKPKDFSTQPVYNHYMNELEFHRDEAETTKKKAQEEDSTAIDPTPQQGPGGKLLPPQLPQSPKE